jgi:hypothetical protein
VILSIFNWFSKRYRGSGRLSIAIVVCVSRDIVPITRPFLFDALAANRQSLEADLAVPPVRNVMIPRSHPLRAS